MKIQRIVSGGQSGVDRAALDAAMELNIPTGGWCPHGRLAEDGPIGHLYVLRETPSADYGERTAWNVRDSNATLILTRGEPTGGTALTLDIARQEHKPVLLCLLSEPNVVERIAQWILHQAPDVLNVAGPRESTNPGIYAEARRVLREALRIVRHGAGT